jgi:hypothetical protein
MPQVSPAMTAAPLLSITGASLLGVKNSHVELQKISSETLATKDTAYADLAKKACEFNFKTTKVANFIARGRGADAQCLREIAINLLLLKDVPGTDGSEFAGLQKKLDALGDVCFRNHEKHSSEGNFVPTIIAHHNHKNSGPYTAQVKLTAAVDAFVNKVPHVHELVRSQLHQDYLKEGLVASFQNEHGVTLDQESADRISQEGTASSPANSIIARQFLSEKQQFTSESLTNTVLIALSQLDLQRNYSTSRESRPVDRGRPETLRGSDGDRQAGGLIRDINNTQIVDVGETTRDLAQIANRLLDMLQNQPMKEVLHQVKNVAVGTDSLGRQTQSMSSGAEPSSSPRATERREVFERVESHTYTLVETKLSEDIRRALERTGGPSPAQDSFLAQRTFGTASDSMFRGAPLNASGLEGISRQQATMTLGGSSSSVSSIGVGAGSSKMFNDSAAAMLDQFDGGRSVLTDPARIVPGGQQPIAHGLREFIVQERLDLQKDAPKREARGAWPAPTMLAQSIKQTIERSAFASQEHGSGAGELNSGLMSLRETNSGASRNVAGDKGAGWSTSSGTGAVGSEFEAASTGAGETITSGSRSTASAKGGIVQDRTELLKESPLTGARGTFTPEALFQSIKQGRERTVPATLEQGASATGIDSRLMSLGGKPSFGASQASDFDKRTGRSTVGGLGSLSATGGTGAKVDESELKAAMQRMSGRIADRYTEEGEIRRERLQSNASEAAPSDASSMERFVSAMMVAKGQGSLTASASERFEAVKRAILAQKAVAVVSDSAPYRNENTVDQRVGAIALRDNQSTASGAVRFQVQDRGEHMKTVTMTGAKDTLPMDARLLNLSATIPKGEVRMPQALQYSTQRVMPNTAIPIDRINQGPVSYSVSSFTDEPVSPQKTENAGDWRAKKGSLMRRVQELRDSVKNTESPFELTPEADNKLKRNAESGSSAVESNLARGADAE